MSASKPEALRRWDERAMVSALVAVLLVLWLGFFVHASADFAGSLWGTLLGVVAALGMIAAAAYGVVKRSAVLRRLFAARPGMPALLRWHVVIGAAAAIVAILHTAHRFASPLGIALTVSMLAVVLSGFGGRYLRALAGEDVRDMRNDLESLRLEYRRRTGELQHDAPDAAAGVQALELVEAMADLEYGLAAQERLQRLLALWLRLHLWLSLAFFGLLAAHVWAGFEFGLRWLW